MTHEKNSLYFSVLQNDYTAWLAQVVMSALYEPVATRAPVPYPALLEAGDVPDTVRDIQRNLHEAARSILSGEGVPERDKMEGLFGIFEKLQLDLQRLDHGHVLTDLGVDPLTGLRLYDVLVADLERELERRTRRGQPFCFVVSCIDDPIARRDPNNVILAAACIQKTIRTFDDAYVISEGEFLSSLKHSDNDGGLRFVIRLNEALAAEGVNQFTLSSVVAEPMPGDNIRKMVQDVRGYLNELFKKGQKNASGQYEEVSPLNKFIQSLNKTDPTESST